MIIHVVLFKLHASVGPAERLVFESELARLLTSPLVASGHWGTPAAVAKRPVTVDDWDYALSIHFKTMEDHDSYQLTDPVHKHFIAVGKPLWQSVRVMDMEA